MAQQSGSSNGLFLVVLSREVIDARGQVAMPGLINCHTHAWMVTFRGVAEDVQTDEWFNDFVWPIESNLTEKDVELGRAGRARRAPGNRRAPIAFPVILGSPFAPLV